MSTNPTVAIVGGGLSGLTVLYHLVFKAKNPLNIFFIEKSERIATGIAFGTALSWHPLNVRAENMGISPEDPAGFYKWLMKNEKKWRNADPLFSKLTYSEKSYLSRKLFGMYLKDVFEEIKAKAKEKGIALQIIEDEILDVERTSEQFTLKSKHTSSIVSDFLVLAIGNPTTKRLPFETELLLSHPFYIHNIWQRHPALPFGLPDEQLVILGSGLTTIDMILTLNNLQFPGNIHVISKNGKFPHVHKAHVNENLSFLHTEKELLPLYRAFRKEWKNQKNKDKDWRILIDSLRPITTQLWKGLTIKSQKQFLRRLLPLWNQHRHRMATESEQILTNLIHKGKLKISVGMIEKVEIGEIGQFQIECKDKKMEAKYLINCSGPEFILERQKNPLLQALVKKEFVQPDDLGLGLKLQNNEKNILSGNNEGKMFGIGGLLFGELFETIAVPDIRSQGQSIANTILELVNKLTPK